MNSKKLSRQRYFEASISAAISGSIITTWLKTYSLQELLTQINFIKHSYLELLFVQFEVEETNRSIKIQDFSGQLQQENLQSLPIWVIQIEMKSGTTSTKILKKIAEFLDKLIDINEIQIVVTPQKKTLDVSKRISILPDWTPGFFTKDSLKAKDLLLKQDIREFLKQTPELQSIIQFLN